MIPNIPELDQLERLASSEKPSLEGAWAHTIQLVDHLYHSFSSRDPVNNEVLFEKWTALFELIDKLELQTAERPIPYDTLHQLFDYSSKAIEKISQNPSKKMVKETAMVSPNRLKSPRVKTMNWIAKQPGRNIREKLAGKNRVLTEQNVFSIQTKENAVFVKVLRTFLAEFRNRLENGINTMLFDVQARDNQLFDEMENFVKRAPILLRQELGEVQPIPVTQPNNMLISDQYYSVIWRAYQVLNSRQNIVRSSWNHALERYVFSTFIQLAGRLCQYDDLMIEDRLGKIIDSEGLLKMESYEDGEVTRFRFFRRPMEKGTIVMVNRDQGYGFIQTARHPKIYFHQSIFEEGIFENLRSRDTLYVEAEQSNRGMNAVACSVQQRRHSLSLSCHSTSIELKLEQWERGTEEGEYSPAVSDTWRYQFQSRLDDAPEMNRGIPMTISGYSTGQDGSILSVNTFADMTGMNSFIEQLLIRLNREFSLTPRAVPIDEQMVITCTGIDFTKTIPMVMVNDEPSEGVPFAMVRYTKNQEAVLSPPNPIHLYPLNHRIYSLDQAFLPKEGENHGIMQSYSMLMAMLREKVPVPLQTPFIYLVPDNIDEFAQKDVKKAISIQFPASFPIWRSVAGALAAESFIQSAKADTILVIDTHGHEASAVKLIRKKHQGESFFQHYPPFEATAKSTEVTLEGYLLDYVSFYEQKYNFSFSPEQLKHLLNSGILEKVLLSEKDCLVIPDFGGTPIDLIYDGDVAVQAQTRWLTKFSMYIHQLQELLREERVAKIDYIVVLGDHLFDFRQLQSLVNERFKVNHCSILSSGEALAAVVNEEVNEKLAEGIPLWFEYLPDLSLEVVKNGHYSKLQLIKDEAIGNTMGMGKVFEVGEHLMLPSGLRTYRFPLIRGGSANAELDAIIKDASFPLRRDTEVKLSIEYKYGYENSYRLFIKPVHGNSGFKQIEAEWVEETGMDLHKKSHLEIPSSLMADVDLMKEVEKMSAFMESTEKVISQRLPREFADKVTIERAHRIFHSTIYYLRRLVVQNHPLAAAFIERFYNRPLFSYCLEIDRYIAGHLYETHKREVQYLKNDIWRYLCSFGEHVHEDVWDYVMGNLERLDDKIGMALLYQNSDNEKLLTFLENRIKKNPLAVIRSLRDTLWRDPDLLMNIYRHNPGMIEAMYQEIYSGIERLYRRRAILKPMIFRDYCEVLLAILALRDKPEFKMLKIGSKEMIKLAKYVREVDAQSYEVHQQPLRSFLQFDLRKPDDLWKMSDLAFVVNAYLTGELMDNLISVREISIE